MCHEATRRVSWDECVFLLFDVDQKKKKFFITGQPNKAGKKMRNETYSFTKQTEAAAYAVPGHAYYHFF